MSNGVNEKKKDIDLEELNNRIDELKTLATQLESNFESKNFNKKIDEYPPIKFITVLLRVFAIFVTVLLAVVGGWSVVGISEYNKFRDNYIDVSNCADSVKTTWNNLKVMEKDITDKHEDFVGKIPNYKSSIDSASRKIYKYIDTTKNKIVAKSNTMYKSLEIQSTTKLFQLDSTFSAKIKIANQKVDSIQSELISSRDLPNIRNIINSSDFDDREKKFLFELYKERMADNPFFNYDYAVMAYKFRKYEEALIFFNKVINSKNDPNEKLVKEAKEYINRCNDKIKDPPIETKKRLGTLKAEDFNGVKLTSYLLLTLLDNGLLSDAEVDSIFSFGGE